MRRGIRPFRTFLAIGCLAASVSAAHAATPSGVSVLTYNIYLGGIEMIRMDFELGLSVRRYDMELRFEPSSFMGRLFTWSMKAYSRGGHRDLRLAPEQAGHENTWRSRRRWVELRYKGGRTVVTGADPKPADRGPRLVPDNLRRGTLDLAAAILHIAVAVQNGDPCKGRVPVYDGRRRYNLVLSPAGNDEIVRSRYSAFEGKALNCSVMMEQLNGFRDPESFPRLSREQPLTVWIGRPFDRFVPVPVGFLLESPYGDVRAHLADAHLTIDGDTRSLTALR